MAFPLHFFRTSRGAVLRKFLLLFAAGSFCAISNSAVYAATPTYQMSPVGVGTLVGNSEGQLNLAAVFEGHNHFNQKKTVWDIRQYGYAESRLEIGTGVGAQVSATSGVTVFGIEGNQKVMPHLGVEPFNFRLNLNSSDHRQGYYEWLPMLSLGIQGATESCRLLPLFRAGGGIGNLTRPGIRPVSHFASGVGAHLNCKKFNFALEYTRVHSDPGPRDFATLDLAMRLPGSSSELGLRAEGLFTRAQASAFSLNNAEGDMSEEQLVLLYRMSPQF